MKGMREVKQRIHVVSNTTQITRAMQLVASSKMKRAQDLALKARPYLLCLAELVRCSSEEARKKIAHPFWEKRSIGRRGVVLVGTERGLCGALNGNVFGRADHVQGNVLWIAIGKKATQHIARNGGQLMASFPISDQVHFSELKALCESLSQAYLQGTIDSVEVVFSKFVNTLLQVPIVERVLPMRDFQSEFEAMLQRSNLDPLKFCPDPRKTLWEPSFSAVLEELSQAFFRYHLYQVLLEAKASEQSARMVAMKAATDNADGLSKELKLDYNKARQTAITSGIIELSMGASDTEELK